LSRSGGEFGARRRAREGDCDGLERRKAWPAEQQAKGKAKRRNATKGMACGAASERRSEAKKPDERHGLRSSKRKEKRSEETRRKAWPAEQQAKEKKGSEGREE
jgi:hypothetical protein